MGKLSASRDLRDPAALQEEHDSPRRRCSPSSWPGATGRHRARARDQPRRGDRLQDHGGLALPCYRGRPAHPHWSWAGRWPSAHAQSPSPAPCAWRIPTGTPRRADSTATTAPGQPHLPGVSRPRPKARGEAPRRAERVIPGPSRLESIPGPSRLESWCGMLRTRCATGTRSTRARARFALMSVRRGLLQPPAAPTPPSTAAPHQARSATAGPLRLSRDFTQPRSSGRAGARGGEGRIRALPRRGRDRAGQGRMGSGHVHPGRRARSGSASRSTPRVTTAMPPSPRAGKRRRFATGFRFVHLK